MMRVGFGWVWVGLGFVVLVVWVGLVGVCLGWFGRWVWCGIGVLGGVLRFCGRFALCNTCFGVWFEFGVLNLDWRLVGLGFVC